MHSQINLKLLKFLKSPFFVRDLGYITWNRTVYTANGKNIDSRRQGNWRPNVRKSKCYIINRFIQDVAGEKSMLSVQGANKATIIRSKYYLMVRPQNTWQFPIRGISRSSFVPNSQKTYLEFAILSLSCLVSYKAGQLNRNFTHSDDQVQNVRTSYCVSTVFPTSEDCIPFVMILWWWKSYNCSSHVD